MCIKTDILSALTYFDIFKYPLTQTEIFFYLKKQYSYSEFNTALQSLLRDKHVYRFDGFFTLQNDLSLSERRRKGNAKAKAMLTKADSIAHFLSSFPFVRGVAVSGSLSKNYADEKSDIDFFIITAANRLWLARTLMHLFKKLTFLFNKEHFFCMNYYVDETGLEIKEKNIYTATEIVTLIPLRGIQIFRDLYKYNRWSKQYLPNHSLKIIYTKEVRITSVKKIIEFMLNNKLGDALDEIFMRITAKRWAKKTKRNKLNANGNVMGMDADKHYAKPDPKTFQSKFIARYQESVETMLSKYEEEVSSAAKNLTGFSH
jgi:hypothetical protein